MWKKLEFIILHFVIVLTRRLFRYLLFKCHVDVDDEGYVSWYNDRCGLQECIWDDGIIALFHRRSSDYMIQEMKEYEKFLSENS